VIRLKPDDAGGLLQYGECLRADRGAGAGVAGISRSIEYRPEYPEAHNNFGSVLRRLGRLDEAREQYHLALQYRLTIPRRDMRQPRAQTIAAGGLRMRPPMTELTSIFWNRGSKVTYFQETQRPQGGRESEGLDTAQPQTLEGAGIKAAHTSRARIVNR